MIEESEALEKVLTSTPLPAERDMPVSESAGRFLVRDVHSKINLPQVSQSGVDGYAVKVSNSRKNLSRLSVIGQSVAGVECDACIEHGEALRVFTGSELPMGANAVIKQEDVKVLSDGLILIKEKVELNDYVRRVGEVLTKGQRISNKGSCVKSSTLGSLIAGGISEVKVGSFPSIGIITTGDELIHEEQKQIKCHQTYDSNGLMLKAAAVKAGVEKIEIKRIGDDLGEISAEVLKMKQWADIIIVVGGMSVGERDFSKVALKQCGVKEIFWRVRIRPGKPMFYGKFGESCQIFGLPGNAVSAFVCFHLFVLPAMRLRSGASADGLKLDQMKAIAGSSLKNSDNRPHYVHGKFREGKFHSIGNQNSNNLLALSQADSLLRLDERSSIQLGDSVSVFRLTD